MNNLSQSGIYIILNRVTGKFYLGSAVDLKGRWYNHTNDLRRGVHANFHLQAAWNKYGEANFKFEVLEIVKASFWLVPREQVWINKTRCWDPEIGYNLCHIAGSTQGRVCSLATKALIRKARLGKSPSIASREKTRESMKQAWAAGLFNNSPRKSFGGKRRGAGNPMFGRHHTRVSLQKMKASGFGSPESVASSQHVRWHVKRNQINPACSLCLGKA